MGASDAWCLIGVVYDEIMDGFFVGEYEGRAGVGPLTQLVDGRVVVFCTGFFVFVFVTPIFVGFLFAVDVVCDDELIRFGLDVDGDGRFGIVVLYTQLVDGDFVVNKLLCVNVGIFWKSVVNVAIGFGVVDAGNFVVI